MATEANEQLSRIETGKDNLVASIENKGVTVADGATIDELSTYVDAIQAATCSFDPDTGTLTITSI